MIVCVCTAGKDRSPAMARVVYAALPEKATPLGGVASGAYEAVNFILTRLGFSSFIDPDRERGEVRIMITIPEW